MRNRYSAYNSQTQALGLRGYNASSLAAAICTNCSDGASPPQVHHSTLFGQSPCVRYSRGRRPSIIPVYRPSS